MRPGPLPEAAFAEKRQQVHALIQEAIETNLAAKGLKRVAEGGDVTIADLVIVGNNANTSAINDYFGYSPDAMALVDKAHEAYTEGDQRDYFEAGTLLDGAFRAGRQSSVRYWDTPPCILKRMGGTERDCPGTSPDTRRTLPVAPLIGDKRCYGECPASVRRGPREVLVRAGAIGG